MGEGKAGTGSCVVCGTRSTLTPMEIFEFNKQLEKEPTTVVANRWGIHPSSARRHKLNHGMRPIVRNAMVDEDRSGFDTVDTLVAAFQDSDLIRRQAIAQKKPDVALRAMTAQQRLAKQLWADLGIDVDAERLRASEVTALLNAIRGASREFPIVAKAIAKHADGTVRDALTDLFDTATAAQKENAA